MNTLANDAAVPQAEAVPPVPLLLLMKAAPIWLLWRSEANADPTKKPRKVPYYVNGGRREGQLDGPEDRAKLVTHAVAEAKHLELAGAYAGLGFALGADGNGGHWQGVDLDDIEARGLSDVANRWVRGDYSGHGYMELSPSGQGAHIMGYGRLFDMLGWNGSGIEAYSGGRFFTYTNQSARKDERCAPVDLADYVQTELAPRHGKPTATTLPGDASPVHVDPKTVTELRSALAYMPSIDRALWVAMGMALKELGPTGRGLWLEWSSSWDKFDAQSAERECTTFKPKHTGYQAVFKRAQEQGWVNPASAAAQIVPATLEADLQTFTMEFAMSSDTATSTLEYLLDPWLPLRCVVGFFGRGATAKSSFLATMAAAVSDRASTLWISVEEPDDWIKVRHIKCGGADRTLAVVKARESKRDSQGRVTASSFNSYEHLERPIGQAQAEFSVAGSPPLRLVVLDTAVGLTTWGKGESPNDDAAVKKLLAHLQSWAEQHNLTIAIIGHANKGSHEHIADTVMGATAWTNSPRLSFIHAQDRREDYAYVVAVAKSNFDVFGAAYTTEPVHTLHERQNGPDTMLVKVTPEPIVWGSMATADLYKEATKKPKDDNDGAPAWDPEFARGPTLVGQAIGVIADMVAELAEPTAFVTRDEVAARLGKPMDRTRWTAVERCLSGHPTILPGRGVKNRCQYSSKPADVVALTPPKKEVTTTTTSTTGN